MNKLRLDLEDLSVESFSTTPEARPENGTVFGQQCTCYTQCTCPGCPTCDASCNGTCAASCNGTCDATCAGTCDASCNGTCMSCNFTCELTCRFTCMDCNQTYGGGGRPYQFCRPYDQPLQ